MNRLLNNNITNNIMHCSFMIVMNLVSSVLLVSLSELLPPEIRSNPLEEWLIYLSFRYTQSQFFPPKNLSCDIWILNPSNELKLHWWSKGWEIPWLANNPQSPLPIGLLDYNMFSLCHFSAFNTHTQKVHMDLAFFMKATRNPSLPHIQVFIEMFAGFACGPAGLVDSYLGILKHASIIVPRNEPVIPGCPPYCPPAIMPSCVIQSPSRTFKTDFCQMLQLFVSEGNSL